MQETDGSRKVTGSCEMNVNNKREADGERQQQ